MPNIVLIKIVELKTAPKGATNQSNLSSANCTQQYIETIIYYQTGFIPDIKEI